MFHSKDNVGETVRKLRVLSGWYEAQVDTSILSPSLRKAHRHTFGLTGFDTTSPIVQSLARSRSGLEVTESILRYLKADPETTDAFSEKSMSGLLGSIEATNGWAEHFWPEWSETSKEDALGKWWPMPVLTHLMSKYFPASTIRSAVIGMEAMGVIERRRAKRQGNPKSRANVVRLTKLGKKLDMELKK
mgnify:CR=1 FL=1